MVAEGGGPEIPLSVGYAIRSWTRNTQTLTENRFRGIRSQNVEDVRKYRERKKKNVRRAARQTTDERTRARGTCPPVFTLPGARTLSSPLRSVARARRVPPTGCSTTVPPVRTAVTDDTDTATGPRDPRSVNRCVPAPHRNDGRSRTHFVPEPNR